MFSSWKKTAAALGASAFFVAVPALPAAAQSSNTSDVYVVHGVPGLNVDVFVNDEKTLTNFTPKNVAGPLKLNAGSYDIKVCATSSSTTPCQTPAISVPAAQVPAGGNVSLVAHLDNAGNPKLTPFVNDVSKAEAGQGRLVVRHTAAAPAVDILASGAKVGGPLSNPNEFKTDLPAGTVDASVVATGTTSPEVFNGDVPVEAGKATVVYAIGNLTASPSTFDVATQSIALAASSTTVHSGTAGLQDNSGSISWPVLAAAAGAFGALAVGARRFIPSLSRTKG